MRVPTITAKSTISGLLFGAIGVTKVVIALRITPLRSMKNLFRPSSTDHLAEILEAYDIFQDPNFLKSSKDWQDAFGDMMESAEVTTEGVVEGQGLVAKRNFKAGELVALYPIHALGYSNGKDPPRIHDTSKRRFLSSVDDSRQSRIIGSSDLLYFEDESHMFGGSQDDFSYSMTDPSGKYCFDVNPYREGNDLFAAHYVNDASFVDFAPIVAATKQMDRSTARDLDYRACQLATNYLTNSTGPNGFNVVMCGFGPPPLMAYMTIRPVAQGDEFLASYGLGYWLGKAFPDETNERFDASEAALKAMIADVCEASEDKIQEALEIGDTSILKNYTSQTKLIERTLQSLRSTSVSDQSSKGIWWKRLRRRFHKENTRL